MFLLITKIMGAKGLIIEDYSVTLHAKQGKLNIYTDMDRLQTQFAAKLLEFKMSYYTY